MTFPSQHSRAMVGATVHLLGNLLTFRATAATTGGAFSLVEVTTAPGAGAPPHLQREDIEAFYVLEGRYAVTLGDSTEHHGPGGFVFVPKNLPHRFENVGATPARMLILNVPGGLHEAFFAEAGDPVPAASSAFPPVQPPDMPRIAASAGRNGITLLAPAPQMA